MHGLWSVCAGLKKNLRALSGSQKVAAPASPSSSKGNFNVVARGMEQKKKKNDKTFFQVENSQGQSIHFKNLFPCNGEIPPLKMIFFLLLPPLFTSIYKRAFLLWSKTEERRWNSLISFL